MKLKNESHKLLIAIERRYYANISLRYDGIYDRTFRQTGNLDLTKPHCVRK